ncbi:MAG TPA: hypothetical protein VKD70_18705 [Candidatus Acidoferrum sp.]|nr:hypothetical protein [Candidatus Acidoferrum sp.]
MNEAKKHGGRARLIVYSPFEPHENPNGIAPGHMIFSADGIQLCEGAIEDFLEKEMAPQK